MSQQLNNDDNLGNEPNTELIYQYTESLLKNQSESLNRLDTKFTAIASYQPKN